MALFAEEWHVVDLGPQQPWINDQIEWFSFFGRLPLYEPACILVLRSNIIAMNIAAFSPPRRRKSELPEGELPGVQV